MPLYISGTNGIGADNTNWAMTQGTDGVMLKPRNCHFRAFKGGLGSTGAVTSTASNVKRIVWTAGETLNNTGSNYNTSTGVFTSTVTGLYYITFSYAYTQHLARYIYIYVMVNGNTNWYGAHYEGASGSMMGQVSGTTRLNSGDTLQFGYFDNGSASYTVPYESRASVVLL
jgi:hypothetical protein